MTRYAALLVSLRAHCLHWSPLQALAAVRQEMAKQSATGEADPSDNVEFVKLLQRRVELTAGQAHAAAVPSFGEEVFVSRPQHMVQAVAGA